MSAAADARAFLHALYAGQPDDTLITVGDKRSPRFVRSPDEALVHVVGKRDVFHRVTLLDHKPVSGRGKASDAAVLLGVWLDVDVNGSPKSNGDVVTGSAPDLDIGTALLHRLAEPTLTVSSGYGLHGYWLLGEPLGLTDQTRADAAALVNGWEQAMREQARAMGFGIDSTADLARVLRTPGSLNAKGGEPVPVELLDDGGRRYTVAQLADLAPPISVVAPAVDFDFHGSAVTDQRVVELLDRYPRLERLSAREGKPPGDGSPSAWDFALACEASRSGLSDGEIAALIRAARRRHRDPKGERADYVERTIAAARCQTTPPAPTGICARAAKATTTRTGTSADLVVPMLTAMREYVRLTDVAPVLAALACAATSELTTDPCWLLLVGGPSCGKTETIDLLTDVAGSKIKALTGPGLLSWKNGRKPHPVGLLARLGDGAHFATITDLSSLLAKSDRGGRDDAFALLRDAYDGEVIRDLGNAPEPLQWAGRLTLLGATTPAVDDYASHQDALGPRWAYLRLPEFSTRQQDVAAALAYRRDASQAAAQARARELAADAVSAARERIDPGAGSDGAQQAIITAAKVAARGRSVVPRHGTGQREISADPIIEEPMRLVVQSRTLYLGLLAIGVSDRRARRIASRLALDSIPPVRRKLLAALSDTAQANISELARATDSHRDVVTRALEDMALLKLATEIGAARIGAREWALHPIYADAVRRAVGVPRDVAHPPPTPQIREATGDGATHTPWHPETEVERARDDALIDAVKREFDAVEIDAREGGG